MICWWDMNDGTAAFPIKSLQELCAGTDDKITSKKAFTTPTFCGFACAYAWMLSKAYSEAQMICLKSAFTKMQARDNLTSKTLEPAAEPYVLKHPFNGFESDVDAYRRQPAKYANDVPFAHQTIFKQETEDLLLEQYRERKELLDKVTN